ncbi:MAG: hypothetical protein HY784_08025 [Chloroflexi bacterium]|nr:hypothetical protein [Chloroflexota bacterium]
MTRAEASENIQRELRRAEQALAEGIDSRARACARRAAGYALEWWQQRNPRPDWPREAFARLQLARDDPALPPRVRAAARQLSLTVPAKLDAIDRVAPDERAAVSRRIVAINRREHIPQEAQLLDEARAVIDWVLAETGVAETADRDTRTPDTRTPDT